MRGCVLSEAFKICPICETSNHRNAMVCSTCGTSLSDVELVKTQQINPIDPTEYDFRYGETDLSEKSLRRTGRLIGLGCTGVLGVVLIFALGVLFGPDLLNRLSAPEPGQEVVITIPRETATATLGIATVTPGPPTQGPTNTPTITPTPTNSPTPAPCIQTVLAGDSLIAIAIRCGHNSQDILPLIVEINDLPNASSIIQGQQIEVPWPTPTDDPNPPTQEPTAEGSSNREGDDIQTIALESSEVPDFIEDPFAPTATATLLPGVMWHEVISGENIITVASRYNANVKILSELNPEVDFAKCDFGMTFGGPECTVFLAQGQLLRVPAPTPTATLIPTISGSETATPSPTATFNAPSATSPQDGSFFGARELVTLRWIPTGTLSDNQVYYVRVEDTTSNTVYTAETGQLLFVLPREWQGKDESRHRYEWTVSVIDAGKPDAPHYTTESHYFVWQGLPKGE